MEKLINILLYTCWWQMRIFDIVDYLNPIYWIGQIKSVKKFFWEKRGVDTDAALYKLSRDPETGIYYWGAYAGAGGLVVCVLICVSVLAISFIDDGLLGLVNNPGRPANYINQVIFFIVSVTSAILVMYFYADKNDKYLSYFKKFESLSPKKRRKVILTGVLIQIVSLLVIILIAYVISVRNFQNKKF